MFMNGVGMSTVAITATAIAAAAAGTPTTATARWIVGATATLDTGMDGTAT